MIKERIKELKIIVSPEDINNLEEYSKELEEKIGEEVSIETAAVVALSQYFFEKKYRRQPRA